MAIYTFDFGFNTVFAPSGLPSTNLSSAASAAAGISVKTVYDNSCLTSTNCNQDTDTNFSSALQSLNTIMPAPGAGTSNAGDTPQEVVFLVTDGVEDKVVSSASSCSQPTVSMGSGQYRCQQPIDTTWCSTVKNRGIRIAVLYTEYLPLPTNSWYNSYVAPFNSPGPATGQIATNLQSCASQGLFYDVQSGGDITAALNALFQLVVASAAHLTQWEIGIMTTASATEPRHRRAAGSWLTRMPRPRLNSAWWPHRSSRCWWRSCRRFWSSLPSNFCRRSLLNQAGLF